MEVFFYAIVPGNDIILRQLATIQHSFKKIQKHIIFQRMQKHQNGHHKGLLKGRNRWL